MRLKELLSFLLPEGVNGEYTALFNEYRKEENFERQYSLLLSLILQDTLVDLGDGLTEDAKESKSNENKLPSAKTASEIVISEDILKVKEAAIYFLANICARQESLETRGQLIKKMLEEIRPCFILLPKAKTAKIVRNIIDVIADVPNTLEIQEELCLETIQWCIEEKRMFLRHRVQVRLAILYYKLGRYTQGLELIDRLLVEVKNLDDKLLLVEIHYIECKLFFFTNNMPKAKAALTAARSNANAIHCPPLLHADIDVMSGAIHCEEGDPKTAYSYFYEAFEAFNVANDAKALTVLKYMMLTKLMLQRPQDVVAMATQRMYLRYAGREMVAFQNIANSCLDHNLEFLKKSIDEYHAELCQDPIISRHIHRLYENLVTDNILKILKPYSRIEIEHIARLMKLSPKEIQIRLNKMILDRQLNATLDQGEGILTLFDEPVLPPMYTSTLAIFDNLSASIDLLHQKAQSVI